MNGGGGEEWDGESVLESIGTQQTLTNILLKYQQTIISLEIAQQNG